MLCRVLRGGIFALLASSSAAFANGPLHLEPSSPWDIDYGLERCSLVRQFGTGDSATHLQIDSYGSWNQFHIQVVGNSLPYLDGVRGSAFVRLTGDPEETELSTLQGKVGKVPSISFELVFRPYIGADIWRRMSDKEREQRTFELRRPQPAYDATVDWISVRPWHARTIVLDVGNMAAPLAAMRTCIDDMFKSWGGDPEVQKSLSRAARPVVDTVRKVKADYPRSMLKSGANAYVPVRLSVDAAGHVSNCAVQIEIVDPAFKSAVCANLTGDFEPALDKDGKPVASVFHTAVVYTINSGS